jgi:hypothetical protein
MRHSLILILLAAGPALAQDAPAEAEVAPADTGATDLASVDGAAMAAATPHTLTFPLKTWPITKATDPKPTRQTIYMAAFPLGQCVGTDPCPFYGQTGKIVDAVARNSAGVVINWPYASCWAGFEADADTAHYWMQFASFPGQWPTMWPATLECLGTCTAGMQRCTPGDTLKATVRTSAAIDPQWAGDLLASITLAGGKTITMNRNATTGAATASAHILAKLPAGNYADQVIQAKRSNGTPWVGMTCEINERGSGAVDEITYVVDQIAAAHAGGYCTINGVNSPITLVRQ